MPCRHTFLRPLCLVATALALVCSAAVGLHAKQSVRVVDSVDVNTPGDEAAHAFAGQASTSGKSAGRTWRSATGWFSYSLRIYDDNPLTLVCLLAEGDGSFESFDILVDGQKVSTVTRTPSSQPSEFKVSLPLAATVGKTAVVVKVAAGAGTSTARLLEVRSVQEHLE